MSIVLWFFKNISNLRYLGWRGQGMATNPINQTAFPKVLRNAVIAFMIAASLALSAYGVYSWQREQNEVRENLGMLSTFLASVSQSFFDSLGNGLVALGQSLDKSDILDDPESVRAELESFQRRYPEIRAMVIFAPDGRMLLNTALAPDQPLPDFRTDPPYIKQLNLDFMSTQRFTVGAPEYGKALRRWRFALRHVVRGADGTPHFLVQAAIPLEQEGGFLHQLPTPESSIIGLLREDGYQQARWPIADSMQVYGQISKGPALRLIQAQPGIRAGFFSGMSRWPGSQGGRFGAITRLSEAKMYAYVSVPSDYVWRRWWLHNQPVMIVSLVFLVLFGFTAYRITLRERCHRGELIDQSRRDALTGLPNRAAAEEAMQVCIKMSKSMRHPFTILFLDIDRFKDVNDSLGHVVGDQLLIEITKLIQGVLRSDDMLARLGGDEFLIVLPTSGPEMTLQVTQRLLQVFQKTLTVGAHTLRVTPSIGIALFPEHGEDVGTLLQHADTAMYEAKREGRNAYSFYANQMGERVRQRVQLEHELREAIRLDEFHMLYQPVVELGSGRIVGAEALVRWTKPNGEVVLPNDFIGVAEDSGLILQLGEWVLRHVSSQIKRWSAGGLNVWVAINISPRQFQDPELVAKVETALREFDLPRGALELEITETAAMVDPEASMRIMGSLKALGLRIAIDDFGTGYSSLAYLKRIPADKIKIDKSFIDGLNIDADDNAIVHTILALAKELEKVTVAEGVETEDQFKTLRALGCELAQGYLMSQPLAAEAFVNLMADSHEAASIRA